MYRELADLYDRIYGSKDYEAESARVSETVLEHNPAAQTLLDVACGTGGHLVHLEKQFKCEGLDLSEPNEAIRAATADPWSSNVPLFIPSFPAPTLHPSAPAAWR